MNRSAEKAGARYGTGVTDKHRCTTSMVKGSTATTNPYHLNRRQINQTQNHGGAIVVLIRMMSHWCTSLVGLRM